MNTTNDNITGKSIPRITCQELEAFIIDFIDNRLTEEQHVIFNTHLEECDHCKIYIADYQKSIGLSQSAFKKAASTNSSINEGDIPEELVQAILQANKICN